MRHAAFLTALLLGTAPAMAEMTMLGDLHIERPMLRETPPNAPVAGGYVTIVNTGEADDMLIAASIAGDVADEVQLHEMTMADGVMTMNAVDGGIPVPAGEAVTLAPGGQHLMVMGLHQPLKAGEAHAITLTFAEAGEVTLDMPVLSLGEIRAATEEAGLMEHGAHGEGHHADHHGTEGN